MSLTLGHIAYLNCVPFFHYLREAGFEGKIVDGVPSELNRMLAAGEIDVSPSSSFEYGLNWEKYLLLPDMSISSFGPVKSVLLFSQKALDQLEGEEIALTGESATSVNLLRILLWEFVGLRNVTFRVPAEPIEKIMELGRPALLIGDRALRVRQDYAPENLFDLGQLWNRYTGLPFVFALWILRKEAVRENEEKIGELFYQLKNALRQARSKFRGLAEEIADKTIWINEADVFDYWESMSYELAEPHLRGINCFFDLCHKYGLLRERPRLEFFKTFSV